MYTLSVEETVLLALLIITGLIFFILSIVSVRRIKRSRYYRRLDLSRNRYEAMLIPVITHQQPIPDECYGKKRFSPDWQAIEGILSEAIRRKVAPVSYIREVSNKLGYLDFYMERICSGNRFHRALAAEKLGRLQVRKAAEDLIRALKDPAREVRVVAVRSLGEIASPECVKPLVDLLVAAAETPGLIPLRVLKTAIVKNKEEVLTYIVPLLHHDLWRVRGQAADIIGEIGGIMPVEPLILKLNDPEPDVRAKVVKALGKIKAREAIPPLIERLKDGSWVVRLQSVKALSLLGGHEVISPLMELLLDSHWQVRSAAGNSLRKMGYSVIPNLLRMLLKTGDRYAREQIVEELQKTDILDKQIGRLDSPNTKEREEASILLVAAGNNGAVGFIHRAVKTQTDPTIRMRLVHILSLIEHPRTTEILQEVVDGDENEAVRYAAKKVLEKCQIA